jgi:iron complex transport system substrate-binding protein
MLLTAIALVFLASLLMQDRCDNPLRPESMPYWQCRRIVSMAPSVTETLYALGLGDCVVGVTCDCRYPSEIEGKSRVGRSKEPNYEAIVALRPDLVVLLKEQEQLRPGFEKLKLETLVVSDETVEEIIESLRTIGRVCGKGPEGRQMAREYEDRLARIREKTQGLSRPRVLVVLDQTTDLRQLGNRSIVGDDPYLNQMIELAGGQNAYPLKGVRYPVVSSKGIQQLNPEVIVELVAPDLLKGIDRTTIVNDWNQWDQIEAVKNRRVVVFEQDEASIHGPRFLRLVEELARALHPEVEWDEEN